MGCCAGEAGGGPDRRVGLVPCSGACNVGQASTRAAVAMTTAHPDETGFVCTLGLPLGVAGVVDKARAGYAFHVALDGCHVGCASRALRSADIEPAVALQVDRDTGVAKSGDLEDDSAVAPLVGLLDEAVRQLCRS